MVNNKIVLRVTVKLMFIFGLGFVIYVFMAGLVDDGKSESAFVVIDIAELKSGDIKYFSTSSGNLLVLKRTDAMINDLVNAQDRNLYAYDAEQNLAEDMHPVFRSRRKDLFVAYAIDPFYRCEIKYSDDTFKSVCVDVEYNLAGRVYKGKYSQGNLKVPDYQIGTDMIVKVIIE
ncbi:MAG: hypothetical protein OEY61_00695 [Gammaproteobacteria bacterium]|nr:hypothetical protein [Gammaproteobacteria bacterium]